LTTGGVPRLYHILSPWVTISRLQSAFLLQQNAFNKEPEQLSKAKAEFGEFLESDFTVLSPAS
jgi:hypothetical protein